MTWLWTALIGAVVGLDSTGCPQVMISRPLVAGALTGLIFGRPYEGLLLGAILEIFHIATLPIGAARYPEAGTAAVSGAAAYLEATASLQVPYLLLAAVFALAWERIAGASVVLVRRANETLVADAAAALDPAAAITRRHIAAVLLDLARGAAVSVTGALAGTALLYALGPLWALPPAVVRGVIGISAVTVLAAALVVFGGWRERKLVFLLGIACGSLLSLLL